jgi:hypothetical protein
MKYQPQPYVLPSTNFNVKFHLSLLTLFDIMLHKYTIYVFMLFETITFGNLKLSNLQSICSDIDFLQKNVGAMVFT